MKLYDSQRPSTGNVREATKKPMTNNFIDGPKEN